MSASDLAEWNAKHRAASGVEEEPASLVRELLPLLPRGPALDLACGTGRHAILLAERGQPVTGIDGSSVALDILEQRAHVLNQKVKRERNGRAVRVPARGIDLLQADLEDVTLPSNSFPVILCIHYLQRSLFSQIERALTPGGTLLFETFTRAQLEFAGGPKNPEYLLEPGELRSAFPSLRVIFYRELRAGKGIASLVAQKPLQSGG